MQINAIVPILCTRLTMPELNLCIVTRLNSNFCKICCSSVDNTVSAA